MGDSKTGFMPNPTPKDLLVIPGIGPNIAGYLWELGFHHPSELNGEDPEALYERFCTMKGMHIDRCLLYVFRCAVYYASHKNHDPDLLQWWNWKERETR